MIPLPGLTTTENLLHQHSNSSPKALSALVSSYNALQSLHENERSERSRLTMENHKLWNWCSSLKRERDALQRDMQNTTSANREIKILASRVMELESALTAVGVIIPPSSRDRLSPANLTTAIDGQADQYRRPSSSPRSLSDSGPPLYASRERQRSGQSAGMMSSSNSVNSFATAGSEPPQMSSAKDRDRDRDKRRQQSTGVLGMQMSASVSSVSFPTDSPSSTAPGAPSRTRDGQNGTGMPPLSSSTSIAGLSSYSETNARGREGLATIPSTPTIHDDSEGVPSSSKSPTQASMTLITSRSGSSSQIHSDRSDGTSSDRHLRTLDTSPMPSSPALSAASATISQDIHSSPVSPNYPPPSPSVPAVQQQHLPPASPRTKPFVPSSSYMSAKPVSSTGSVTQRPLRRKASSLDLASTSEKSPVPSRSATPPPHLKSPTLHQTGSSSPTQFVLAPRTPPPPTIPGNAPKRGIVSQYSTPMVELPDEVRRYIMAQHGGMHLPSPGSPQNANRGETDRRNDASKVSSLLQDSDEPLLICSNQLGGLGTTSGHDENSLAPDHPPRLRRASSALQGVASHQKQSYFNDRATPNDVNMAQSSHYSGTELHGLRTRRGSVTGSTGLQEAHRGISEGPVSTASPVQQNRADPPERNGERRLPPQAGASSTAAFNQPHHYSTSQTGLSQYSQSSAQDVPNQYATRHTILQPPPVRSHQQLSRDEYGEPKAGAAPSYGLQPTNTQTLRYIPLVPGLLSLSSIEVINSSIKIADRQKEVVSFLIRIQVQSPAESDPRHALMVQKVPTVWIIEKTWNDLQSLDLAIKSKNAKANVKKLPGLPDKSLFKDHAPSKVDQRKVRYDKQLAIAV